MKHTGGALLALMILAACGGSDASPPASAPASDGGVTILEDGAVVLPPAPEPVAVGGKAVEGVFVSASKGIPGADASAARPLKTIAEALPIAKQKQLPVIVCAETYAEQITMLDGVTMYGYFDCSNLAEWKRVTKRSVIASPTSPAVLVDALTLPARFEGFEAIAPDIVAPGDAAVPAASSYGMLIKGSANLSLAENILRGGKGQDGVDGAEPAPNQESSPRNFGVGAQMQIACSGQSCLNATITSGSLGGTSQCAVGGAGGPGGKGGDGAFARFGNVVTFPTVAEASGKPLTGTTATAVGGLNAGVENANLRGAGGAAGSVGQLGPNGEWAINGTGFLPGNGTAGSNGGPGQGGGGGGGGRVWYDADYLIVAPPQAGAHYGIAGAGGGAGGCAGVGGQPGTGGGASVGLFVISSSAIKVSATRIESGKGGRAGKGASGNPGSSGGAGGPGRHQGAVDARPAGVYGLAGGTGGPGGAAGLSGHGSAGPSIGLVFNGAHPDVDYKTTQVAAGAAGDGQPLLTVGAQTRPAVAGVSKPEHAF